MNKENAPEINGEESRKAVMIKTDFHLIENCGQGTEIYIDSAELEFPIVVGDELYIDLKGEKGFTELVVKKRQVDVRDLKRIKLNVYAAEFKK